MSKMNSLLSQRMQSNTTKMTKLAALSAEGNLSSFSGIFRTTPLSEQEQQKLSQLLTQYRIEGQAADEDLQHLLNLTSEVKAITNQAAILHGERIKKAQDILKRYRDGAFSAWLITAYGNRQTPYNFLQYYEFYKIVSENLRAKLDAMPRQAVYTLASREAPLKKKEAIIENFRGEKKSELLALIRKAFPLSTRDKRASNLSQAALIELKKVKELFSDKRFLPTNSEREALLKLLQDLQKFL